MHDPRVPEVSRAGRTMDHRVEELERRLKRAERQLCVIGWTAKKSCDFSRRWER